MRRTAKTIPIMAMVLAVAAVQPLRADYWSAVEAYERGDYGTARKELEPLAAAGDAKSQVRLGLMYREGRGAPRDARTAFSWLLKAAKQGRPDAQFLVGTMYRRGEGTPQDEQAGVAWLRRAAAQGNAKAAEAIARVDGGAPAPVAAPPAGPSAEATAQAGSSDPDNARRRSETEAVLAAMDPPATPAEVAAINKAAAHGVRVRYGSLSAEPEKAPAEKEKAPGGMHFQPSRAPSSLQDVIAGQGAPRGPLVDLDGTQVSRGGDAAADAGTKVPVPPPDSVATLQQRATQGDRVAQRRLAAAYLDGKELPRDPVRAAQWYRKAALQGDAESQFVLSGMYYRGEGVPRDAEVAVQWLRRAAAQGHAGARARLAQTAD
ncbi:MAG: tetratricopeptide repeat protein [Gammaproteobacteria bacterium]